MSSKHNKIYSSIKCHKMLCVFTSFLCGVILCACAEFQDATGKTLESANDLMYPNKTQLNSEDLSNNDDLNSDKTLAQDEQELTQDAGYGEPMLAKDSDEVINNDTTSSNKKDTTAKKTNGIEQSTGKVLDNAGSIMNYGMGRVFKSSK